ncbi:MAG: M48 family metallopeptidase [Candidatus Riflebacteria bacterium]|nr:M48 family metallopeptidase [Candidatus Riflebacteria bacterium]
MKQSMIRSFLSITLILVCVCLTASTAYAGNLLGDLFKVYQTYEQANMMLWLTGDAKAEKRFGEEVKWFINLTNKKYKNPEANRWVHSVFDRLKPQFRERGFDYNITLLEGKEVNAFAIPGGSVFIFKGILDFVSSDDELAAVLAHELTHSEKRHSLKQLRMSTSFEILLQAAVKNKRDRETWGQVVGALTGLQFTREHEEEADAIGQRKMFAAGFDPSAQVMLWEKFVQKFGKGEQGLLKYLGTHPPSIERVAAARKRLAEFKVPEKKSFALSYNILSDTQENLIQNGSFETDINKKGYPDTWAMIEGKSGTTTDMPYSGKTALFLDAEQPMRPVRVCSELISVDPKVPLVLRGKVRSYDGTQKASVGAEVYDSKKRLRGFVWPVMSAGKVGTSWTEFTGSFKGGTESGKSLPPDTAFIRILLQNGPLSKGNVYFDDLTLQHEGAKGADNILAEGDFEHSGENGFPAGVTGTPGLVTRDLTRCKTGYASAHIAGNAGGAETILEFAKLPPERFKDGQAYQISWHYCGSAEIKARLVIEMRNEAGNALTRRLVDHEFTAKPNLWEASSTKFEFKPTDQEKHVLKSICVRFTGAIPAGASIWVDGVILR